MKYNITTFLLFISTLFPVMSLPGAELNTMSAWKTFSDGKSQVKTYEADAVLQFDVNLKPDGGYYMLSRKLSDKLNSPTAALSMEIKADANCDLEINFIDQTGKLYNKRIPLVEKFKNWTRLRIMKKNVKFGWQLKRNKPEPAEIQFGFSGKGRGKIMLRHIRIEPPVAIPLPQKPMTYKNEETSFNLVGTPHGFGAYVDFHGLNGWAIVVVPLPANYNPNIPVKFDIKADADCMLEIKFVSKSGKVNLKKIPLKGKYKEFTTIVARPADGTTTWQEAAKPSPQLHIGFSGTGKGKMVIKNMVLGKSSEPSKF